MLCSINATFKKEESPYKPEMTLFCVNVCSGLSIALKFAANFEV
jgi:hypothetical protein